MNKKGFTLIELLGVIIILSIIMVIAIPNVTSVLEKNKRETYITDAKKFITQVKTEISNNSIEKPSSTDVVKVKLSYIGTNDVSSDSDGNKYDTENSFVVVVRNTSGYLGYYVNLVAKVDDEYRGIKLASEDELSSDEKLKLVNKDANYGINLTLGDIETKTGIVGAHLIEY